MSPIDGILFLLTIAALLGGLAGMILPSLIKLKSRLVAFGIFLSGIIFASVGAVLDADSEESIEGLVGVVTLSALMWGAAWLFRQVWRSIRQKTRETPAAHAEGSQDEKVRREIEAHRRMAAALKRTQPVDLPPRQAFQPSPRLSPPTPRAPSRRRQPKIEPDRQGRPKAKTGTTISFTYVDADGEITDRELRNWSRTSQYIEGYCLERRAVRTFRIDRVIEWGKSD